MALRIRIANIDDVISMSVIHAKSWEKAYQGLLPD
ncbi:MAG TPA: GNAT family N-acetyltransferase, partial [Firmicutes bacterium]|nr:GNAT family N-acetyltransferase [Bacillota bacterium]